MDMGSFEYVLPEGAIAQTPVEPRDAARLLVATDPGGGVEHKRVADLSELLGEGDVLVVNETRVLPARLRLRKATGGTVEVLLLEPDDEAGDGRWQALVRPGRRLAEGTVLEAGDDLAVEIGERLAGGRRAVRLRTADQLAALSVHGVAPLPPYIHVALDDPERYQTVYASRPGSVAAPTAGLHLTDAVLDRCRARGVEVATVDLAVGLDTFRPVTAERAEDHEIHSERYRVPAETLEACRRARRVVAVGTTTVRALESAATGPAEGRTSLFIHGHFEFRVVDVLLTNFHMPRSSLLLLLASFAGGRWRELYACALAEGYRFLSFGDAMLVGRAP
jgi:S-adenosylmethionine:tRNA ribosyltransferase-isomerase